MGLVASSAVMSSLISARNSDDAEKPRLVPANESNSCALTCVVGESSMTSSECVWGTDTLTRHHPAPYTLIVQLRTDGPARVRRRRRTTSSDDGDGSGSWSSHSANSSSSDTCCALTASATCACRWTSQYRQLRRGRKGWQRLRDTSNGVCRNHAGCAEVGLAVSAPPYRGLGDAAAERQIPRAQRGEWYRRIHCVRCA